MSDSRSPAQWAVHRACYVLLAGVFVFGAVERHRRSWHVPGEGQVASNLSSEVQTRIDPNVAPWSELARLPEIGETMARQIVDYRENAKARLIAAGVKSPVVFQSIQGLDPIRGFGEKRLKRVEPFLRFPPSE